MRMIEKMSFKVQMGKTQLAEIARGGKGRVEGFDFLIFLKLKTIIDNN